MALRLMQSLFMRELFQGKTNKRKLPYTQGLTEFIDAQMVETPDLVEALDTTQKKQRITNYGKDVSIEKDDNGNCKMTQDLSSVGIKGVSATQYFKCGGKTQFERRFSAHMKEAMQRYK